MNTFDPCGDRVGGFPFLRRRFLVVIADDVRVEEKRDGIQSKHGEGKIW